MNKNFTLKRIILIPLVLFLIIFFIPFYIQLTTKSKIYTQLENSAKSGGVEKRDFAIVLGAGIKGNNKPGAYLHRRLDDAIELYNNGKIQKLLLTGDNSRVSHDEISVMNNYLLEHGIPQNNIFGDYAGFDTYSSMERAKKIFNIKNAIIVSQGFHLPRSIYIARTKGINAIGYTSSLTYGLKKNFVREWFATIKSFFDCTFNRKSLFYGEQVNTNAPSNIVKSQLKKN